MIEKERDSDCDPNRVGPNQPEGSGILLSCKNTVDLDKNIWYTGIRVKGHDREHSSKEQNRANQCRFDSVQRPALPGFFHGFVG